MNSRLLLLPVLASITLASCGKKTETKVVEVPVYVNKQETAVVVKEEEKPQDSGPITKPQPDVIKTEAELTFKKMRKTELEFDSNEKFSNFDRYILDLNKRKIVVLNEGRALDNGVLRCSDETDPTNVVEKKVNFKNDGTKAELEILLPATNTNPLKYSCAVYENNIFINKSAIKFEFFADKIIDKPTKYNELGLIPGTPKNLGAIVILEKGSLITNGQQIEIKAEEVIAIPGAKIQTFLESDLTAADNKDGLSGGSFDLKTNFIVGKLKAEVNGQNGGKRTTVPAKETRLPDFYRPGTENGVDEVTNRRWRQECRDADDCEDIPYEEVVVAAESGKDGQKGRDGQKGDKGTSGGDTGRFTIMTNKSPVTFLIEADLIPGKGSEGGSGGEGGPPTPAGKMPYCREYCTGIKAGTPGKVGDSGSNGDVGKKGQVQYFEFINLTDPMQNRKFDIQSKGV